MRLAHSSCLDSDAYANPYPGRSARTKDSFLVVVVFFGRLWWVLVSVFGFVDGCCRLCCCCCCCCFVVVVSASYSEYDDDDVEEEDS